MIYEKFCSTCNRILPAKMFFTDKNSSDGLRSSCKNCTNENAARNVKRQFTNEQIWQIRELALMGYTHSQIAKQYKVDKRIISDIVNRKTYSDID